MQDAKSIHANSSASQLGRAAPEILMRFPHSRAELSPASNELNSYKINPASLQEAVAACAYEALLMALLIK